MTTTKKDSLPRGSVGYNARVSLPISANWLVRIELDGSYGPYHVFCETYEEAELWLRDPERIRPSYARHVPVKQALLYRRSGWEGVDVG